MIGRAAIGYPWVFKEIKHFLSTGEHLAPPSIKDRVEAAREHLVKSVEWKGEKLGILEMRRHYTNYFKGLPGIKDFRMQMVDTMELKVIEQILEEIVQKYAMT